MQKTVDKNARDTVIELDGGECEVVFSAKYSAFALMNNGATDVVMSIEQGKTQTDDGVRIIGSGESAVIAAPMLSDTLYVTGAGRVQIAALMGLTNPFKPTAKGGGASSGGGDGGVSKEYVDQRDAVTLAAAKKYADDKAVTLEPATATTLGGVMVGDGLTVTQEGKLSVDPSGTDGEPNTIKSISVNGAALTPDSDKNVDIVVPTKTSDLDNDSQYQTAGDVQAAIDDKIGGGVDVDSAIATHNADEAAHPFILGKISELEGRVRALELANGGEVTANPFAVTFGSLDGTISDGIWDSTNMRLGF